MRQNIWKLTTFFLALLLIVSTSFRSVSLHSDDNTNSKDSSHWGSHRMEALARPRSRVESTKPSIWGMMVRTRRNIGQAFVTVENIRALGTSYHFHFFLLPVGNDSLSEEEFFSDEFTEIFDIMNVTREVLPLFPYPNQWIIDSLPYGWNHALHRLSMFGMYDKFDKILLTDADVVFVAPVEEMFELTKTALVMFPEPGQCVLPDTATGGFVFIRPEKEDFDKMMAYAAEHADDRNPYWAVGEKTFLGNYFKTDLDQRAHPSTTLTLSHMYTYPLHDCNCKSLDFTTDYGFKNLLKAQLKIVKVYHFTPGPKPWVYPAKDNTVQWDLFPSAHKCIHPVVEQYYKHRADMVAKLTDRHLYSLRICRTTNDKSCTPKEPS